MRFRSAAALLGAVIVALYLLRTPDTDPAAMREKYANAASQFAVRDGLSVHYRDQGRRDGAPLLLIHGSYASLHTWEPLIAALGPGYRTVSLTLPGHGLTGPHPDDSYAYADFEAAIAAVLGEAELKRVTIVGSSMGGWIAWRYALAHPERVNALILLDASGAPRPADAPAPTTNLGFRLMSSPVGRFFAERYTPRWILAQSLRESVEVQEIVTEAMIDRYWELLRYPGNRRATNLRADMDREPQYAERLSEIAAPTLILWGEEDRLVDAADADVFHDQISNATLIVYPNVGHLPMEEAPGRVGRDIEAFLNDEGILAASR